MNLFVMAWRNIWRNQRRTLVTVAAMGLALFVELVYSGLIQGILENMQDDFIELETGHLQVHTPAFLDQPSLHEFLPDAEAILARIDDLGYPAAPRLIGGGLAASGEFSSGVTLRGLDPARESGITRLAAHVQEGVWLDPADPKGVVVGRGLARTLSLGIGGELIVLSQGTDGSVCNDLYTVRGVLGSVASGTDRGTVFMLADAFRELLVLPDGAHEIVVRRPPEVTLDDAKAAVEGVAGEGARVMTWREIQPVVGQMLDSTEAMMTVIYLILYLAVAILVLNAMLMAVFERIREFGVLKAIGAGPFRVFGLILVESLLQAALATVVGGALAAPAIWFMATRGIDVGAIGGIDMMGVALRPIWQGIYTPQNLRLPVILLFVIVTLAVLYPALKAARIQPVQAMRQNR
ncbi:MAG: ABC transporter permease [Deltaproteobacteria bacterium]|nr:ABC transporter permease [Deltaproteobacteria bacterium]